MITRLLIWVGEPYVEGGQIVVRWVACGTTAAGLKGMASGNILYQFGATLAQKQTALLNRAKADIPGQYPGATFSPTLTTEYLGL